MTRSGACLRVVFVHEGSSMAAVLCCTTLAIRTDPLEAPTPQTVAPWAGIFWG